MPFVNQGAELCSVTLRLNCSKAAVFLMENVVKRPVGDIIIGAFASGFNEVMTRNEKDFTKIFPDLKTIVPFLQGHTSVSRQPGELLISQEGQCSACAPIDNGDK